MNPLNVALSVHGGNHGEMMLARSAFLGTSI